ncbi:hypothetical protein [Streptomyces sp. NBC_00525]|uniref:hypothetical protein n=1 Tax=Streptomyces sp. NBC_00525 TaxID=2903660 RepID=UPI002E818B4F|nr:hypothetical protein [Streptomyces sp. NBC_00525]WUC97337.1 sister chromatid cohesion protein PDS5 [Streptomyces sp. NBC_00525]
MELKTAFREHVSLSDLEDFAGDRGWDFAGWEPATEVSPEEYVWRTSTNISVHRISDELIGLHYLILTSADRDALVDLHADISSRFDVLEWPEALEEARTSVDPLSKISSLSNLAACAPEEFDEGIFTLLNERLLDSDDDVREVALIAICRIAWREFSSVLGNVITQDTNANVRDLAETALAVINGRYNGAQD